jgi:hypothetical protein
LARKEQQAERPLGTPHRFEAAIGPGEQQRALELAQRGGGDRFGIAGVGAKALEAQKEGFGGLGGRSGQCNGPRVGVTGKLQRRRADLLLAVRKIKVERAGGEPAAARISCSAVPK